MLIIRWAPDPVINGMNMKYHEFQPDSKWRCIEDKLHLVEQSLGCIGLISLRPYRLTSSPLLYVCYHGENLDFIDITFEKEMDLGLCVCSTMMNVSRCIIV